VRLAKFRKACEIGRVMKQSLFILPLLVVLPSCKKESSADVPKAVEVREEVVIVSPTPTATEVSPVVEVVPAETSKTPGQHLDHALQKTGEGIQTAGEKTEHGLKVAREKTEAGIDKAAEKTGEFLKRVGEKIEDAGQSTEEP